MCRTFVLQKSMIPVDTSKYTVHHVLSYPVLDSSCVKFMACPCCIHAIWGRHGRKHVSEQVGDEIVNADSDALIGKICLHELH